MNNNAYGKLAAQVQSYASALEAQLDLQQRALELVTNPHTSPGTLVAVVSQLNAQHEELMQKYRFRTSQLALLKRAAAAYGFPSRARRNMLKTSAPDVLAFYRTFVESAFNWPASTKGEVHIPILDIFQSLSQYARGEKKIDLEVLAAVSNFRDR